MIMPIFMSNVSHHKLDYIVTACQSLTEFKQLFSSKENDAFIAGLFSRDLQRVQSTASMTFALEKAVESSSQAIDILWITISFISLGLLALWLAGVFALAALGLFFGGFYYQQRKNSANLHKQHEHTQFALLKIHALDELIRRYKPHGFQMNQQPEQSKPHLPTKSSAVSLGVSVSIVLLTTFYWGITDSLVLLGLMSASSLLAGPIGLGVAAVVAITIGALMAVKYYQAKKAICLMNHSTQWIDQQLQAKTIQYDLFKQAKLVQRQENKHDQTLSVSNVHQLQRSSSFDFFKEKQYSKTLPQSHDMTSLTRCPF